MSADIKMHTVKIKLDSTGHGFTEVDGVVLRWAKGVSFESNAGMPTLVTIRLWADEVEVEVEAELDDAIAEAAV